MNRTSALATAALSLVISAVSASAGVVPQYSVTDIGFLPGFANTTGVAIDIHGDVVGYAHIEPGLSTGPQTTFLYSQGSLINVGPYGNGTFSFATGVNDNQEVLGTFNDVGDTHSFFYLNGKTYQLDVLNAYTYASAINNGGQIVGTTAGSPPNGGSDEHFAFLLQPNLSYVQLPTFKDALVTPVAINDIGQIVGNVQYTDPHGNSVAAVVRMAPGATTFHRLKGLNYATGMNSTGNVVGYAVAAAGDYGVLRAERTTINLGPVSPTGINNHREIVGNGMSTNGTPVGEVYIKGQWYDLNALVNPTLTGLTITGAAAINNLGQIVATATDASGNTHTLILTVE